MAGDQGQIAGVAEAQRILKAAIPQAADVLVKMLAAQDERLRIRAAEAILNRVGLTEADRVSSGYARRVIGGDSPGPYGPASMRI